MTYNFGYNRFTGFPLKTIKWMNKEASIIILNSDNEKNVRVFVSECVTVIKTKRLDRI